jgi:predicted acylesterase/phospholipase RssA
MPTGWRRYGRRFTEQRDAAMMTMSEADGCGPEVERAPDGAPPPSLGEIGQPVRALAFGGGLFDTAMQLGVVHALLVSRGRTPDVVVGISAGAVNAVALAEVLQAEPETAPVTGNGEAGRRGRRLAARVARFRRIFEHYLEFPTDLLQAMRPDTAQIDVRRPLAPLRLPIHHEFEWKHRLEAVKARAGLLNLYNELLDLRMTVGTMARAVRRFLGLRMAAEGERLWQRLLLRVIEGFQLWQLLGENLVAAAPLARRMAEATFDPKPEEERGASAAELIFGAPLLRGVVAGLRDAAAIIGVASLWTLGSLVGIVALAALGSLPIRGLESLAQAVGQFPSLSGAARLWLGLGLAVLLLSGGVWLAAERTEAPRAFGGVLWSLLAFVGLTAMWSLPAVLAVWGGLMWRLGASTGTQQLPGLLWFVAVLLGLVALPSLITAARMVRLRKDLARRLLARYRLSQGLFDPHPLRRALVELFDPTYYGHVDLQAVVDRAIRRDQNPGKGPRGGKLLNGYARGEPPIHVVVTAADVATGKLVALPDDIRVVDALLAAVARTPFLPPVAIDGTLYVDGTNVVNEPTRALLNYVRDRARREAGPDGSTRLPTALRIYTVTPYPFSRRELAPAGRRPGESYGELVDIARRSLELRRFRDATLDRRLTELHTRASLRDGDPDDPPLLSTGTKDGHPKEFVRAWVHPIEPREPLGTTLRVLGASGAAAQRELISRAVADGCKAALEAMIWPAVDDTRADGATGDTSHCRLAVAKHLGVDQKDAGLPGENPASGPGLAEVCRCCAFYRASGAEPVVFERPAKQKWPPPEWPLAEPRRTKEPAGPTPTVAPGGVERKQAEVALKRFRRSQAVSPTMVWPRARATSSSAPLVSSERPTVSLLFSGGVFRGVYLVGVLNALSEVELYPDVIAGASVGSITAAMVARAFQFRDLPQRRHRVAWLAATYLAVDRLILTDRFADFVRGVTVRAAATRFSLRQLDRALRRLDDGSSDRFNRELRSVMAGIERLTWVSPFELRDLVEAIRRERTGRTMKLLGRYFQELLDRSGVSNQVLGAEPLERLIAQWVLDGEGGRPQVPFDVFLERGGVFFLATVTNLTRGRLEILGSQPTNAGARPTLLDGLLASSAFPGVFRPRWSWEMHPQARSRVPPAPRSGSAPPGSADAAGFSDHEPDAADQYVDGGVMDNLPLDAVAEFLDAASRVGLTARRPRVEGRPVPHLLFGASLEVDLPELDRGALDRLRCYWPALWRRSKALGYNQKLTTYANTQQVMRGFAAIRPYPDFDPSEPPAAKRPFVPVDLEVVCVKPRWLCETFAFHPMLGFRREEQARSIAHGCASTLLELARYRYTPALEGEVPNGASTEQTEAERAEAHEHWLEAWGVALAKLPPRTIAMRDEPFEPVRGTAGDCWFRPGVRCPFAPPDPTRPAEGEPRLPEDTARAVGRIYHLCGERRTHAPRA